MGSFEDLRKKCIKETKKKVKESVKADNFIIQSIKNIDEIIKVSNILIKRLREWYELSNPEFSRSVRDHGKFIELILEKKDKKEKESMGADFSKEDMGPILKLASEINELYKLKQKQEDYLHELMQKTCPNLTAVAGYLIGAKLIALAGDLKKLVEFPSSTVQLLGAEKALFRHMRTGAKSPRHGIIVNHPLISGSPQKEHGKRARALADKLSLAAKVDYFKGEFIGDKLKKKLEDKFKK
jgi:nucleolar protein 56